MPIFSIITVVFNGAHLLPGTLESVKSQTFTDFEHLVIDGGSSDGTLEILERYSPHYPQLQWISERDKGLYDAMNKGLRMAKGEFVWFMNCGDHLHRPDTLANTAARITPDTDVLYGDTLLVYENRQPAGLMSELSTRSLPDHMSWHHYLGGMRVVHQSFVARRTLAPPYEMGNLCADYDWSIKILKQARQIVNTRIVMSDYLMGGLSKQKHRKSLMDRFEVMRRHFGWLKTIGAHIIIVFRLVKHRIRRYGKLRY